MPRRSTRALAAALAAAAFTLALVVAGAMVALHVVKDRQARAATTELRQTAAAADDRIRLGVARARATAIQIAADPAVVARLTAGSPQVPAIVRRHADAALLDAAGKLRAGHVVDSPFASVAKVSVGGHVVGSVRVGVPFAPIAAVASPPYRVSLVRNVEGLRDGAVTTISLGHQRLRALGQRVDRSTLLVSVPLAETTPANSTKAYIWIAAAATWLTIVLLVAPGRGRARPDAPSQEALRLFGEALAATHDPQSLISAFLRIAVETVDAVGGAVEADGVVLERIGPHGAADLSIPLRVKGGSSTRTLLLTAPPGGFRPDALGRLRALALQASAALTNAYLHEIASERSQTDELTSLANRRRLLGRLTIEVAHRPLSVIAADLDRFKSVNDLYGHQSGDVALRHFAAVIGLYTREIDLPARVGGDEFVVLLPHTEEAGALALAERIRAATAGAQLTAQDGRAFTITASFGVATIHDEQISVDKFLARADAALYRAKEAGRNAVVAAQFSE
jgi:diguanylate cyclase (GGDEF)-like protein